MKSKLIRIGTILIISFSLGVITALATNKFVGRPYLNGYWTDCVNTVQDGVTKRECAKKLVSSRGWPFPSVNVYSDGSRSSIKTDTYGYCIGGCDTTSIGDQFIYNTLLLTVPYALIITFGLRKRAK